MLLKSLNPDTPLQECFKNQTLAVSILLQLGTYGKYMLNSMGRFLLRFWLEVSETRRFAISKPDLYFENLNNISVDEGSKTAIRVIKATSTTLKYNLHDDIVNLFNRELQRV